MLPFTPLTVDELLRIKVIRLKPLLAESTKNALMGISATLLIATLSWQSAQSQYGRIAPWIWWLAYSLIGLRHIQVARAYEQSAKSIADVLSSSRSLLAPTIAAGCVWGSSSWLMLPVYNSNAESILIIGNAMVLMGVAIGKGNDRSSTLGFMIPATAIFVLGLWRLADQFHFFVGVGFIIFTGGLISFANVQAVAIETAVRLRLETEKLLRERTTQQLETDRARKEAEQAKGQAELANQSKTTFLTAAGHDLRQPMHALVQYFGQLKRSNSDPRLEGTIERIGRALDSMQDLLDSILEVSKLMMGSVKPSWSRFNVSLLLDRLEAQVRPVAEEKGLSLVMFPTLAVVQSDEILLERILRNLTLNAIRYTECGQVVVRAKLRGGKLMIQVFDSGIGIARTEREKIFEPYYQIANEARDRRKGLGLGLAIVRHLSDLLGTRVWVRSKQGRGSMFGLEMAISGSNAFVPPPQHGPQVRDYTRGAFVMLIDDNEESLQSTELSLKSFGCQVLSAHSGIHAVERLQCQELMPQLVIADYRLVGETGLEAVKMVIDKQHARFGDELDIAVLIVSGDTAPLEMENVLKAGHLMLHKPLKYDALYQAVNARLTMLASQGSSSMWSGSRNESSVE